MVAYQRARQLEPANLDALVGSGVALTQLQRPGEAITQFGEALAVEPRSADAHNWLGVALAGSGRLPDAIAEFDRALALNPAHQNARQNRDRALRLLRGERP